MGFENYISESEAAVLAGISVQSLKRFADAGYFRIETESDGLRLYARTDLERVFGIKPLSRAAQGAPLLESDNGGEGDSPHHREDEASSDGDGIGETPLNGAAIGHAEVIETAPVNAGEPPVSAFSEAGRSAPEVAPSPTARTIAFLEQETQKQRLVIEMHERLLALREDEIRSLKEEREWLRARIEKLEEKGQRDQLLLLSETQTIKTLITIQEQRRSPMRLALEWLGFVTPPSPTPDGAMRKAIDVSPKREDQEPNKKAA